MSSTLEDGGEWAREVVPDPVVLFRRLKVKMRSVQGYRHRRKTRLYGSYTRVDLDALLQQTRSTIVGELAGGGGDGSDPVTLPSLSTLDAQRAALSGPVQVLWDTDGALSPLAALDCPPLCVAVTGIDFGAPVCRERYTRIAADGVRETNDACFVRMCLIWYHVCSLWREAAVQVPVPFEPNGGVLRQRTVRHVDRDWARALRWVLDQFRFPFQRVVICVLANDQRIDARPVYDTYVRAFQAGPCGGPPAVPVTVLLNREASSVAHHLTRTRAVRTGLLVTTLLGFRRMDSQGSTVGYHWNYPSQEDRIGTDELLCAKTTLDMLNLVVPVRPVQPRPPVSEGAWLEGFVGDDRWVRDTLAAELAAHPDPPRPPPPQRPARAVRPRPPPPQRRPASALRPAAADPSRKQRRTEAVPLARRPELWDFLLQERSGQLPLEELGDLERETEAALQQDPPDGPTIVRLVVTHLLVEHVSAPLFPPGAEEEGEGPSPPQQRVRLLRRLQAVMAANSRDSRTTQAALEAWVPSRHRGWVFGDQLPDTEAALVPGVLPTALVKDQLAFLMGSLSQCLPSPPPEDVVVVADDDPDETTDHLRGLLVHLLGAKLGRFVLKRYAYARRLAALPASSSSPPPAVPWSSSSPSPEVPVPFRSDGRTLHAYVYWGHKAVSEKEQRPLRETIAALLGSTPTLVRASLHDQRAAMRPPMRAFLGQLTGGGEVRGLRIDPPSSPAAGYRTATIGGVELTPDQVATLQASTEITYLGGEWPAAGRVRVGLAPGERVRDNPDEWDPAVYQASQRLAVTGPVHVLWRVRRRPEGGLELVPRPRNDEKPPVCVSVAGINFAYSTVDFNRFVDHARMVPNAAAREHMRTTCFHMFHAWKQRRVDVPVLCALGCGAFRGDVRDVPESWATAMRRVLGAFDFGFRFVVISLPGFGGGNDNLRAFREVFRAGAGAGADGGPKVTVVLTEHHGIADLADVASRMEGVRAGLLNPSDVAALRLGCLGMYWADNLGASSAAAAADAEDAPRARPRRPGGGPGHPDHPPAAARGPVGRQGGEADRSPAGAPDPVIGGGLRGSEDAQRLPPPFFLCVCFGGPWWGSIPTRSIFCFPPSFTKLSSDQVID